MAENIKLGGNIELVGFEDLSVAESIVAKKIIGGFARNFSDNNEGYEHLVVQKDGDVLSAKLSIDGAEKEASDEIDNFFMSLGKVLNKLEKEIKK